MSAPKVENDDIAQRRDEALRRALRTAPKPQDQMKLGTRKKRQRIPNAPASSKKT